MFPTHYDITHIFDGEEIVSEIDEDGNSHWLATFRYRADAEIYVQFLKMTDVWKDRHGKQL